MNRKKWVYPFYNILHPIEGVEEMHYYRRQSLPIAIVIFLFYMFVDIFAVWFTGPQFDIQSRDDINLLKIFALKIAPILLWAIANWAMCVLNEGKAKFVEIITITMYAFVPYIITKYVYIILSNFLLVEEGTFITWMVFVGIGLSVIIMATELMYYHEYSLSKVVGSSLLTVVGMVIILFLAFLLFTLFQQIITTVLTVYNEISIRLK